MRSAQLASTCDSSKKVFVQSTACIGLTIPLNPGRQTSYMETGIAVFSDAPRWRAEAEIEKFTSCCLRPKLQEAFVDARLERFSLCSSELNIVSLLFSGTKSG